MIKGIKLNKCKVEILTRAIFGAVSDSEIKLLKVLISFSTNNSITLTPELSKQVLSAADISQSNFNTALHRLQKKGVMSSMGKTKVLHPVYNNIEGWDQLLIKFSPEQSPA